MAKKEEYKKHFKKNKKNATPLRKLLQRVYHDRVSLETTCNHRCECCKVAMPQLNYSEAVQILQRIWETNSREYKIKLICKSVEYFFRNEFEKFGMDILIKPCMLLNDEGLCSIYEDRPLSCRMYGLWPADDYTKRVDKFEKFFDGKLSREEIPLNKQCPYVKRKDDSVELTTEVIDRLYSELDDIDANVGSFTELQLEKKENYRTLHDWILYFFFGEEWLNGITDFMIAASKEEIEDLVNNLKEQLSKKFAKDMPDLNI